MNYLTLMNRTRSTLLGYRIVLADTWWTRFRGFWGRPEPEQGEGILLYPCSRVHTFGMAFPLDVLFLDPRGHVLDTIPQLGPWRTTPRVPESAYALELPAGTMRLTGTRAGDRLTWRASRDTAPELWLSRPGGPAETNGPTPTPHDSHHRPRV